MDDHHHAQEAVRQAPGGYDDEVLAKLTAALRAGLAGSGQGPDLLTGQMPADADPFEFFASVDGQAQVDSTVQHRQDLPRENLPGGTGILERRVALMAQDMAAFGVLGREGPLRLHPPGEDVRHEYFA